MTDKNINTNTNILSASNLSAGYEREIVVGGVNLSVRSGEILCLIGPNGSGKSTILKTITRELEKLGGKIFVLGKDSSELSAMETARHVSMVMTEKIRPEFMTCREIVETARYPYTGRLGLLTDDDKAFVESAIKTVGAEELSEKQFAKVSDGQKQRIMLARAIAQGTEVIVLDEPTSYLDMRYKIDLIRIIRSLAKEQNKAVIMSLHELDLVKAVADTVVCVGDGKVVRAGTPDEIFSGNFIQKLYGINDGEFEPETAMMKIDFSGVLGAKPLGEGVASNEVRARGRHSPHTIMIQGTMSNAGKSLLVAGLCRILRQDGWKAAPFKSQNMALNSYVTADGLEMGRAQVMQAEAAGVEPSVLMNPILLKPTSDRKSQVIVNGEVVANMDARDYFDYKKQLVPAIMDAFGRLSAENDIIVIEGAGSPAEINLRENDIVNMGLAEMVDAPVLLVGDIDRGGVFAQLLGTLDLLSESERARVKGLVINKFRGDVSLLEPGLRELEARGGVPVTGVVPYMKVKLDDEDSLSSRFEKKAPGKVNIGVVRLPHISNFTDFMAFERFCGSGVVVHYISEPGEVSQMDMIVIPGSKNTIGDLRWIKENGMAEAVNEFAGRGGIVFGICGGYQMLGKVVRDPEGVEGESAASGGDSAVCQGERAFSGVETEGLGLLNISTTLEKQKARKQVSVKAKDVKGFFDFLNGKTIEGYEIHQGRSEVFRGEGATSCDCATFPGGAYQGNVYGTYIHGFFDSGDIALCTVKALAERKGFTVDFGSRDEAADYKAFKESQYDLLADTLRRSLDMNAIYKILGISGKKEACDE